MLGLRGLVRCREGWIRGRVVRRLVGLGGGGRVGRARLRRVGLGGCRAPRRVLLRVKVARIGGCMIRL